MKPTVKFGLIFAAIWIGFKLILFSTLTSPDRYNLQPAILANILCLLLAITLGLYFHKRNATEQSNALGDIKSAMGAGMVYTMIVTVFLYFYYSKIDPEYNQHQRSEAAMQLEKMLNDPEEFKKLKGSNGDFEVMSKDEIRASLITNQEAMYSTQAVTTIGLLGMLMLATVNSILISIVMRRVIFKGIDQTQSWPIDQ